MAFPGPHVGDLFLSADVRTRLHLRPSDEQVPESRFLIHALLVTPRTRLYLSYPSTVDDTPQLPATCLQELLALTQSRPLRWESLELEPSAPHSGRELCTALGNWARAAQDGISDELIRLALDMIDRGGDAGSGPRAHRVIRGIEASLRRSGDASFSGSIGEELGDRLIARLSSNELSANHDCPVLTLSSSALEDYLSCPFRFFMKRVLRITPPKEFEEDISALDFGNLVHQIVHRFYRNRRDNSGQILPVTPGNVEAARDQIGRVAAEQMAMATLPEWLQRSVLSTLLGPKGLLPRFLQIEAGESGWRPIHVEAAFGIRNPDKRAGEVLSNEHLLIECQIYGNPFIVAIHGIIDRIDEQIVAGRRMLRVVDYKTGKPPQAKDIREGHALQLPLYVRATAEILGCDVEAVYYGLSSKQGVKIYDYPRSNPIPEALEGLDEAITDIVQRILKRDFAPQPQGNEKYQCGYCDFRDICRRSQMGSDDDRDSGGTHGE